ncbi:MAG: AbrB/MazE/SpoVT family DNA-binding domain-containing protein [Deltaproteobacteria bacterium]|nr:AbrB/MazE/SpoVT family DNA-binding domain-containing protein [Deltaproteobacteria bacterium]
MKKPPKTPWRDLRQVFRSGNSLAITLPSLFIRAHNIKEGDHLKLFIGETLQVHPPEYKPKAKNQARPHRLVSGACL